MTFPGAFGWLFPVGGDSALILDGFVHVSVVLLLFIAGLEVDLGVVIEHGKQAFYTSLLGLIFPFFLGFIVPFTLPELFGNADPNTRIIFAVFMGTSMSITALPVIARILMDLKLFRSRLGMLIISAAMINDLIGWLIFTVVLSMMGQGQKTLNIWETIGLTLGFTLFMLTIGKGLIKMASPLGK